jgi:hypothetical protein
MPDNTAHNKRELRLRRLWPNESEDETACPPFGTEIQAGDWRDVVPDEPVFRRPAPPDSLFHPLHAAMLQSVYMHMSAQHEANFPQLAQNLAELRSKLKPSFKAVIGGESVPFEGVEAKFDALVKAWRQDTMLLSDQVSILTHPSYYAIIGMGREALPFIFKDLARGGGSWFVALSAITQENPVSDTSIHDARRMREDWLAWGRVHGYLRS